MFNLPKKKAAAKKAEGEGDAAVTRRMMHGLYARVFVAREKPRNDRRLFVLFFFF